MRIAVASNDRRSVSQHFGKSRWFVVFQADDNGVVELEARANSEAHEEAGHGDGASSGCGHEPGTCGGHEHGHDSHDHGQGRDHHTRIVDLLADCGAVIAGGMGPGAMTALEASGIAVALCPFACSTERAAELFASGSVQDDPAVSGSCSCHH